jgi:hypothetical protein
MSERTVQIEHKGQTVSGTYTLFGKLITVMSAYGFKTAQLSNTDPDVLARIMLRELMQEREED